MWKKKEVEKKEGCGERGWLRRERFVERKSGCEERHDCGVDDGRFVFKIIYFF